MATAAILRLRRGRFLARPCPRSSAILGSVKARASYARSRFLTRGPPQSRRGPFRWCGSASYQRRCGMPDLSRCVVEGARRLRAGRFSKLCVRSRPGVQQVLLRVFDTGIVFWWRTAEEECLVPPDPGCWPSRYNCSGFMSPTCSIPTTIVIGGTSFWFAPAISVSAMA